MQREHQTHHKHIKPPFFFFFPFCRSERLGNGDEVMRKNSSKKRAFGRNTFMRLTFLTAECGSWVMLEKLHTLNIFCSETVQYLSKDHENWLST